MKPTTQPRIVLVAGGIAKTQARRTAIAARLKVLLAEVGKLNCEDALLNDSQRELSREIDKLSAATSVLP